MGVPIVVGSSSTVSGTALTTLRERLLETLGFFATGVVTTEAASLEAARYLISTAMKTDQKPPEHLDGLYVWLRTGTYARTQRMVVNGAFDGPIGALAVDYPYDGAVPTGTVFEVGVLPAEKYLGCEGATHILNLALEELPVLDILQVTALADTTQYSLAGYPWPIKKVSSVIYPRTSTTNERRRELPRACWDFVNDAESPILSFRSLPFNAGDTFEIELHRPASTRVKSGGSWGDSDGLAYEDDECLYDAATVVREARPIALQRMSLLYKEGSKERMSLEAKAEDERATAALSRLYGRFKGSGAQRIGAARSTGWGWGTPWA